MQKWIGLGALVALTACDVPEAPIVTGPDGQPRIQISTDGLTCYQNSCLRIDPFNRTVNSVGNRTISISGNIDVSGGTVSPEDFNRMYRSARLAGGVTENDRF